MTKLLTLINKLIIIKKNPYLFKRMLNNVSAKRFLNTIASQLIGNNISTFKNNENIINKVL